MSLRSPLGKVLGLGSAKEGPGHWWAQRTTAVALAPLGLWFVFSIVGLRNTNYQFVAAWVADPAHAILLILLLITLVYHSYLGLQVVVEDYLHGAMRVLVLLALRFMHVILVVAGIFSVITISVGASE
jgi:succinate dehydrogenase / fumarate reductase membrane anchor subunit